MERITHTYPGSKNAHFKQCRIKPRWCSVCITQHSTQHANTNDCSRTVILKFTRSQQNNLELNQSGKTLLFMAKQR